MDSHRFDAFARMLTDGRSRRGLVRLLAGLALGVLVSSRPEESWAESGKCKKKCGPCQKCDRGKCEKKNGKTRRKPGKCKPKANGTPCTSGVCQDGICDCAPGQQRSGGVCATPPNCVGQNQLCTQGVTSCCSNTCFDPCVSCEPACACSTTGEACNTSADCCGSPGPLLTCVGFKCVAR